MASDLYSSELPFERKARSKNLEMALSGERGMLVMQGNDNHFSLLFMRKNLKNALAHFGGLVAMIRTRKTVTQEIGLITKDTVTVCLKSLPLHAKNDH